MSGSTHKETGMRARRLSDERGIALAVAVFALVVIGALVAGTFFAGRLEQQTGRNAIYAAQAAEVAEAGLNEAVNNQTAAALLALPVLDADPVNATALTTYSPPSGYASATRSINRLTDNLFLVRSLGTRTTAAGGQLAARSLAQLIRLVQADITVNAGLTALGDVTLTGGAEVSGNDAVPALWVGKTACPPLDTVTGVRYNEGTLTANGKGAISGQPDSILDPTLNTADMKKEFDKLKLLATLTLTNSNPAASGPAYTASVPPRCDTAVETNWGEPALNTDPCFDYFPIIYHYGNLKLQGGRGQGILLVEGDLTATGGMVFYGPVFVTGTLSTSGNKNQGAKFFGGVIAGNVALDDVNKLTGGALVTYSSCAIKRALDNTATPGPLAERSWVQLYQ
jgi:Tfp pilus assembly protein PilX